MTNSRNMEAYIKIKPMLNFSLLKETSRTRTVSGDLGGVTLTPGIYNAMDAVSIQKGNLTLDAKGDENAVWVFQLDADFTTVGGAGGNIILTGNAKAKNIFWQTDRLAIIGEGTSFKGNILAKMPYVEEVHAAQPLIADAAKTRFKKMPTHMGWPLYGQHL